MMRAVPNREDLDLARSAAFEPASAFEQFHGLLVLEQLVPHLSDEQCGDLTPLLQKLDLATGGDRDRLRARIMDQLDTR
jgi:hypothetical protein